MVKKIIKYDLMSFFRSMLPVTIVLWGIALFNYITFIFYDDSTVMSIASGSSILMFNCCVAVYFVFLTINVVKKYYTNLFSTEGYLTLCIPVKSVVHVVAKLFSSLILAVCTGLSVFVAYIISTGGKILLDVPKTITFFYKLISEEFGGVNAVIIMIEVVVLVVLFFAMTYLKYFACISIGQLAKKGKIWLAIGIYFGLYSIRQILGTIFAIAFSTLSDSTLNRLNNYVSNNEMTFVHNIAAAIAIIFIVLGTIYFIISKEIISKKVNLE